jgi:dihydroorotase
MSTRPAQILGLPGGTLKEGAPADVVVIDPNERWQVQPEQFRSLGRNTPFAGWTLVGKVRATFVGGVRVYPL